MSQLQVTGEAKIRDIQGPVVANDGVITALDGSASQYVRGDGTLADFPTSSGGGSSVSYYLNSSVSQGTIGGVSYRELSKDPIIGGGTDIAISSNGYVANYITDVNDPDVVLVPGGNFNCEFYFSVNNNTGNPTTYAELYKYDGTTFTLLGTSAGVPESINQGTTIAPYYFAIPVATATLALTDRLAIRIYVNVDGRTVTLHTENSHLCQVVTTLSKGMVSLNNLTDQSQYLTTGTAGTNFAIVSSGDTHTFNLPVASATNTGKLSSTDWSTFNGKVPYTGATASVDLGVYDLIASGIYGTFIEASVNGLASSPLVLRTGTTGFSSGTDAVSLISSPTSAHTLSIISNIASPNVTKRANIGLDLLSATRTFTLPDLSGTLALLESAQTFTGKKTFSNGVNITGDVVLSGGTGYGGGIRYNQGIIQAYGSSETTTEFTDVNSIKYYVGQGSGNYKNFVFDVNNITLNATRTYSLPDASGTIALLEGSQTFSGSKTFSAATKNDSGVLLKNGTMSALSGYTGIGGGSLNNGIDIILNGGAFTQSLLFQTAAGYSYTFPAASGTIALTSNLSAYLPLTGGTLTGALAGTSATFSGAVTNDNGLKIKFGSSANLTASYLTLSAYGETGSFPDRTVLRIGTSDTYISLIKFRNNTSYTYDTPAASGTLALTSDLSAYLPLAGGTLTGALSGTSATFSGDLTIDTNTLFVDSTNNRVGIGTTTPNTWASNLVVYNNQLTITGGGYDGTFADSIFFGGNSENTTYRNKISNSLSANAANQKMKFSLASGATTFIDVMTLVGNGNVGIGTSSPYTKFQVNGGNASILSSSTAGTDGTGDVRNAGFAFKHASADLISALINTTAVADWGLNLHFNTRQFNAVMPATPAMTITAGQNVGINFDSPSYPASRNGMTMKAPTTNGTEFVMLSSTDTGFSGGALVRNGADFGIVNRTNGNLIFATNAIERMYITSGGQTQVKGGTAGFTSSLAITNATSQPAGVDIGFTAVAPNNTTNAFLYCYDSSVACYTIWSNGTTSGRSDERLKKNIAKASSKIEDLMKLDVVNYEWNDSIEGIKEIGLIAQNVEEVFPSLVVNGKEDEDGNSYKQVKYSVLPIINTKAIQDLYLLIQEQQVQIEELKALILAK